MSDGLRVPLVVDESLGEGYPNLVVPLIVDESLGQGYPNLHCDLMVMEVLIPVAPEPYMSNDPFPGFGNSTIDPTKPAAADPFNTKLPGLSFSVHKIPQFNTKVDEAASMNEVRVSFAQYPRWEFQLTYEFLEDRSGAESSLKTIVGFFLSRGGRFDSWLFKDPDDYLVVNGAQGTGDAVTLEYPLLRDYGGFSEVIGQVDQTNDINVYLDGVLVDPGDYTVTAPNLIVFDSAPADGAVITADFQFFFVCRFKEDTLDFEKFYDKLWNLKECDFRSIPQT